MTNKYHYRPEIDGLRALAIIFVIFYHAKFDIFKSGYFGVDIFFFISGYLITNIICENFYNKKFSLINFWERRARRIFPALFFVIFFILPICWVILYPKDFREFGQSIIAIIFFLSNVFFYNKTNYFDTAADLKPLLHTWSLSVEGQFYLFYPIILIFLLKKSEKITKIFLIVVLFINIIFSHLESFDNPQKNFYFINGRLWEILLGCVAAVYHKNNISIKNNYKQLLSSFGFLLIIFPLIYFDERTPTPSLFTLIPILGAWLILLYADKNTLINKFLTHPLFQKIGILSYSLYLWHFPLFSLAKYYGIPDFFIIKLIIIIICLILSIISFNFVEKPFRNKIIISKKKIFFIFSFFIIFLLLISLKLHFSSLKAISGIQKKDSWLYKEFDIDVLKEESILTVKNLSKVTEVNQTLNLKKNVKKILIIGDSMADDAVAAINKHNHNFYLWKLSFDDLCLDSKNLSKECVYRRKELSEKYSLIENSDLIFYICGFQIDTNIQGLSEIIKKNDMSKLTIISSAHFNEPYALNRKIDINNVKIYEEKKLDLIFGEEIHAYTWNASLRAKKIAKDLNIPFILGYDLQCIKINEKYSCPFIRNKKLLIFDTAHKTKFGLEYYGQQLIKFINKNI